MSSESPFWLHSVSVVVTAEFHNPSILNHSFLVSEGIVPREWEFEDAIATPPFSVLRYSNGIQWIVEQSKLIVTEMPESSFQDKYLVHELASTYLEKLPHVPYRSLGLNCELSIGCENPQHWLKQQFLNPDIPFDVNLNTLSIVPKESLGTSEAQLHLTFNVRDVERGTADPKSSVVIDCNVHHEGPLDSSGLRTEIQQWPNAQGHIVSVLSKLLGD